MTKIFTHATRYRGLLVILLHMVGLKEAEAQYKLWGMSSQGGSLNGGDIFSLNTDGSSYGERHAFQSDGQAS